MSEMPNILQKIVDKKRDEVARYKQELPLEQFQSSLTPSDRDFVAALRRATNKPAAFILECKKASPSKGLIRESFDPVEIANAYQPWAAAISVLTDEPFFQGHYDFLEQVRSTVTVPVLCKDFMIDPYQVYRARHHGADAILLMLSVLDDDQYRKLFELAAEFKLDVLTEVANEQELERAIYLDAPVIGINNRDLTTLDVDLNTTHRLASKIPADRVKVSESGIYTNQQVRELAPAVDAFLVGSSLTSQQDIHAACRSLILGHNKVCGLSHPEDVAAVEAAGAEYGGLIFYPPSPRAVTLQQASELVKGSALKFVGVFVDVQPKIVAQHVTALGLAVVQLHGNEDADYVELLRGMLPGDVEIWKAHRIGNQLPDFSAWRVDRHLLDTYRKGQVGGTGDAFNWQLLTDSLSKTERSEQFILAGGLTPENVQQATAVGCYALDINSGVESAPGVKDPALIDAVFNQLRTY